MSIISTSNGTIVDRRLLRRGEYVPTAARTAQKIPKEDLQNPDRLRMLYQQRESLKSLLETYLPIEVETKVKLETITLERLKKEIVWHECTPEFDMPIVDPSFLAWKNTSGLPAFAVFPLGSPRVSIHYSFNTRRLESRPKYPAIIGNHYLDDVLLRNVHDLCSRRRFSDVTLSAKYEGVMPNEVREKIRFWSRPRMGCLHFEEIFIVSEAPDNDWKIEGIAMKKLDPLVIGIHRGLLWLIAAYDLTPVEEFVQGLYATNVGHGN